MKKQPKFKYFVHNVMNLVYRLNTETDESDMMYSSNGQWEGFWINRRMSKETYRQISAKAVAFFAKDGGYNFKQHVIHD